MEFFSNREGGGTGHFADIITEVPEADRPQQGGAVPRRLGGHALTSALVHWLFWGCPSKPDIVPTSAEGTDQCLLPREQWVGLPGTPSPCLMTQGEYTGHRYGWTGAPVERQRGHEKAPVRGKNTCTAHWPTSMTPPQRQTVPHWEGTKGQGDSAGHSPHPARVYCPVYGSRRLVTPGPWTLGEPRPHSLLEGERWRWGGVSIYAI